MDRRDNSWLLQAKAIVLTHLRLFYIDFFSSFQQVDLLILHMKSPCGEIGVSELYLIFIWKTFLYVGPQTTAIH